jgi:hypothetical protein
MPRIEVKASSGYPDGTVKQRVALAVILGIGLLVSLDALRRVLAEPAVAAIAALSAVACVAGFALIVRAPVRFNAIRVRALFYAIAIALALQFALLQPYRSETLRVAVGAAGGLFAAALLVGPRVPPRARRAADIALMNAALILVGAELALRLVSAASGPALLAQEDATALDAIERHKLRPGEVRFGFPANALGHYDADFAPTGGRVAASIGDSFGVGVVPHALHFTTVCERELPGWTVWNFGVGGAGPREYLWILEREALPRKPDVVVLNLFLGNDLDVREWSLARACFDRRNLLLAQVPRRLLRIGAMRQEAGPAAAPSEAEARAAFPWVDDPMKEEPALAPELYLEVERKYFASAMGRDAASLGPLFGMLDRIRAACGETRLVVVLIPATFQVEDDLWRELTAGRAADRDAPQRLIGDWLRSRGVEVVDLLPALRAVEPLADGRRHVYHRNDTHFNARGNRVAGLALARVLGRR